MLYRLNAHKGIVTSISCPLTASMRKQGGETLLAQAIESGPRDGDGLGVILTGGAGPGAGKVGGFLEKSVPAPLKSDLIGTQRDAGEFELAHGEPGNGAVGGKA